MTMVTFEITLNPLIAFAIVLISGCIGFMLKKRRIAKDRNRVNQYEKEMILNHAEILELQKDYINLELKMRELTIPVIPINASIIKEGILQETEMPPIDTSARKKLLGVERLSKENVY
jgi:hypothetical protein